MQFSFPEGSGNLARPLAVTAPILTSRSLLLATGDAGADAVHIVDMVGRGHAGYVASPGSIAGPRGVVVSGASPQLVAASAWKTRNCGDHVVVVVYRGSSDGVWDPVRVIGGGFACACVCVVVRVFGVLVSPPPP
jgi:hypothetical protein